jgi:acetyl esterase/lipase
MHAYKYPCPVYPTLAASIAVYKPLKLIKLLQNQSISLLRHYYHSLKEEKKMATKQSHTFKVIGPLTLKVDIYTPSSSSTPPYDPETPIVLWLHGGGFVAADRACLPPHIVQSCLSRNWPLVSADYRKLPQTSGTDVFEDVKDAYRFVVEKVPVLLGGEGRCERVVVMGASAGLSSFKPTPINFLGRGNWKGQADQGE